MTWATIMAMHDRTMLTLFAGVVTFAFNWYTFTGKRARQVLSVAPFVMVSVIMALEFAQRVK
jgi:ABC-type spermidine/putrescine transport system permease subunit II